MPLFSSLDRLNAMHSLFTTQGNGKLDAGETDALVAFYRGLPDNSAKKIEARLIDIYKTGAFAAGQKTGYRELLRAAGIPGSKLDPSTQVVTDDKIVKWQEEGHTKKIDYKDVPTTARAKLKSEIKAMIGSSQDAGEGDLEAILHPQSDAVVGYYTTITDPDDDDPSNWEITWIHFNLKGEVIASDSNHT